MTQQFIDLFYFYSLELIFLAISFGLLIIYKKKVHQFLKIKEYKSKQRLHKDEIPRFGGIIIYLFLFALLLSKFDHKLLRLILLSFLPMAILTIKEDLHYQTSPLTRIFFMIISCLIFTLLIPGKFPTIDIPIISKWFEIFPIQISFYIFSMMVIMNGNNLIDGVNGNMTITNIVQLLILCFLSIQLGDHEFFTLCFLFILPLLIFLPFNFPFGKIFMGDTGAYFYGFAISGLVVYFFGKYDELLSWFAVLLLFYTSFELLFSFVRKKFIEKKSPFSADAKHLHSLIFRGLNKKFKFSNNSFVTVCLLPLITSPFLVLLNSNNLLSIFFSIFVIFVIYFLMYFYFLNLTYKK